MSGVLLKHMAIHRRVFPLRLRFSHKLASRAEIETVFVKVVTESGAVGYGQALPREYLTGETMDSCVDDMRETWWPRFRELAFPAGCSFSQAVDICGELFAMADDGRKNASYAAMETAVVDAVLHASGQPAVMEEMACSLPVPLVGVIGGSGARKAAALAGLYKMLGFTRFKVKVGRDRERDRARLAAVRRAVGKNAWLAVDANAAWTPDEAAERMRELAAHAVALVEEPLTREAAKGFDYKKLERDTGVAVMADESICTTADGAALADAGSPAWWNLRLAKNGGFSGMAALSGLARRHGVRIYGGILVGETGVLAAAGRVGMLMAGVECGEYGFSRFFLKGDPFRGAPAGYFGSLPVPDGGRAGLGVGLSGNEEEALGSVVWRDGE